MTATVDQNADGGLVERVESLLSSLTAVVSARVILDEEKGPQVHIIATSEMPVSEVSRAVISALTWGLGFEVPSSQIRPRPADSYDRCRLCRQRSREGLRPGHASSD